jgi:dienelactone hydrolase
MPQPMHLPNTQLLTERGDLAELMVAGIQRYLLRATEASVEKRQRHWHRDTKTPAAYAQSVEDNRQRLAKIIGAQDPRSTPELSYLADRPVAHGRNYEIHAVRWRTFERLDAEGLLLEPKRKARAQIIAIPDADQTPESLAGLEKGHNNAFAARLAQSGCRVLIPVITDRACTHSGLEGVRMSNQPHREFIYRAAFELGRHLIGFEIQKVLAAIDGFSSGPIGVIGYGEGGLLALYAAALDQRIEATAVSGYFRNRQTLWREPIYRNVFGLLEEFGDAEIASLIAPRHLIIENCPQPTIDGPPTASADRTGAAPGRIITPSSDQVTAEFRRAQDLTGQQGDKFALVESPTPCGESFLQTFLRTLGIHRLQSPSHTARRLQDLPDAHERRKRQFRQLVDHTQDLLAQAEFKRQDFWAKADARNTETWAKTSRRYRLHLYNEVIGRLPAPKRAASPRSRLICREKKYLRYEVVLDVYRDVFAYGILLLPKNIKKGERRPVVVCQHGLEGRPQDVADANNETPAYHRYACRLADLGYIVFAPQNPYIGEDNFRRLQRLANPLKLSLFSFITRQHQRILQWLSSLAQVDAQRIAFYGLSYGGKTAMRVPALLEEYCLSICSADYNEWIWKNASARHKYSYLLTGEYEMPEFDLGNTFNYAEMSWLICPRPFMVERGHHDGVAPDEWVAYEYARTYRRYVELGLADKSEIEFFDGPHTIHGEGTFRFLRHHLGWPKKHKK